MPRLRPRVRSPAFARLRTRALGRATTSRRGHRSSSKSTNAVRSHLEALGPVIVEPVNVGIFFKGKRNFVELRPKTRWLDLTFGLNRVFEHPRIAGR